MRLNLRSISDQLRAEPAPATIIQNEYSAVPMNNFGDYMLVRRISSEAILGTRCHQRKHERVWRLRRRHSRIGQDYSTLNE